MQVVIQMLLADTEAQKRILVLATDGEPDTCEQPKPNEGQQESIDAAAHAYANGIPVYVIGIGDDVGMEHLQDVANAGAGVGQGCLPVLSGNWRPKPRAGPNTLSATRMRVIPGRSWTGLFWRVIPTR